MSSNNLTSFFDDNYPPIDNSLPFWEQQEFADKWKDDPEFREKWKTDEEFRNNYKSELIAKRAENQNKLSPAMEDYIKTKKL